MPAAAPAGASGLDPSEGGGVDVKGADEGEELDSEDKIDGRAVAVDAGLAEDSGVVDAATAPVESEADVTGVEEAIDPTAETMASRLRTIAAISPSLPLLLSPSKNSAQASSLLTSTSRAFCVSASGSVESASVS